MLMNPKKKVASLIIAKLDKDKGGSTESVEKDSGKDSSIAEDGAMGDLMEALANKDKKGAIAAFKALMYLCEEGEEDKEDSSESEME